MTVSHSNNCSPQSTWQSDIYVGSIHEKEDQKEKLCSRNVLIVTSFKQKVKGVKQKQVLGIQILEKGGRKFILRQTTCKRRYCIAITKQQHAELTTINLRSCLHDSSIFNVAVRRDSLIQVPWNLRIVTTAKGNLANQNGPETPSSWGNSKGQQGQPKRSWKTP